MSPKGPRGNFKHQSVRVSMVSIYSSHWNGRTGNTKGVIAGAPRLFCISRGHPRTPVKPPKRAWWPSRPNHGETIGDVAGGTWDQHHSRLSHSHTVKMGPAITAEDILRSISSSNRETGPGQMEGRYSSTRRRLTSLSSDHFLWLETEGRGPESSRWVALGCQHMRSTHLCLWRICLCEGRTRIILFPWFRSCGSTWCDQ